MVDGHTGATFGCRGQLVKSFSFLATRKNFYLGGMAAVTGPCGRHRYALRNPEVA